MASGAGHSAAPAVRSNKPVAGDVARATLLRYDDRIGRSDTMLRAVWVLRQAPARDLVACAAHRLAVNPEAELLADAAVLQSLLSGSVPPFRPPPAGAARGKWRAVAMAPWFAQLAHHSSDASRDLARRPRAGRARKKTRKN